MTEEIDRIRQNMGFDLLLLGRVALIVLAAFVLERALAFIIRRAYLRSSQDPEDRTRYRFLRNGIRLVVGLLAIAESSLTLRAAVWAKAPLTARVMHFDLNRAIKLRFDREGIELPYPHRTLTFKSGQIPSTTERP